MFMSFLFTLITSETVSTKIHLLPANSSRFSFTIFRNTRITSELENPTQNVHEFPNKEKTANLEPENQQLNDIPILVLIL